ncbi:MAG: GtrA family protein [Candidatus Marinimicrobia bacterium]|nr:GtrA family protein [Candidatus Neomarinimicrobiota bacterium]
MKLKSIIRFQIVAWIGTLVNLGTLWLLHGKFNISVPIAGGCAIEVAILHNFTWYYLRTWKDRVEHTPLDYFRRLWKYNLITAGVDFIFNLGLLWTLNHFLHIHYLLADILGMIAGPFFKIFINELIIFKKPKLNSDNP